MAKEQNKKMNIILIGFMGSGKSTVGRLLAHKKNMNFIDIDDEIEKSEGLSITEIFKRFGEKYFRDIESIHLEKISKIDNSIVATGGGIVLKEENIKILKKNGTIIFLDAEPEIIYKRIKNETQRPLLQIKDPQEKIKTLLNERISLYNKTAEIKIKTANLSPEEITDKINFSLKFHF